MDEASINGEIPGALTFEELDWLLAGCPHAPFLVSLSDGPENGGTTG